MSPTLNPLLRLAALVGAGVTFTGVLGWLIWLLQGFKAVNPLSLIAYGVLALLAIVLVSLAAVNFKATLPGGSSVEIDGDGKA
jgi:hypothetical protein